MTKSSDFLIKKIKILHLLFPDLKIRYEYRITLKTHFIEILPFEIFENNNTYILKEMQIEDEFNEKYEDEEILFISSNSLNEIKNCTFSI